MAWRNLAAKGSTPAGISNWPYRIFWTVSTEGIVLMASFKGNWRKGAFLLWVNQDVFLVKYASSCSACSLASLHGPCFILVQYLSGVALWLCNSVVGSMCNGPAALTSNELLLLRVKLVACQLWPTSLLGCSDVPSSIVVPASWILSGGPQLPSIVVLPQLWSSLQGFDMPSLLPMHWILVLLTLTLLMHLITICHNSISSWIFWILGE
jgi:hypothetical protein